MTYHPRDIRGDPSSLVEAEVLTTVLPEGLVALSGDEGLGWDVAADPEPDLVGLGALDLSSQDLKELDTVAEATRLA